MRARARAVRQQVLLHGWDRRESVPESWLTETALPPPGVTGISARAVTLSEPADAFPARARTASLGVTMIAGTSNPRAAGFPARFENTTGLPGRPAPLRMAPCPLWIAISPDDARAHQFLALRAGRATAPAAARTRAGAACGPDVTPDDPPVEQPEAHDRTARLLSGRVTSP